MLEIRQFTLTVRWYLMGEILGNSSRIFEAGYALSDNVYQVVSIYFPLIVFLPRLLQCQLS